MKRYYHRAKSLATSATAKDTYVLFGGNIFSAFLNFVFTLLVARGLSVATFGVFSAINNLVIIIASVSDIGISAGLVSFIARFEAKGEKEKSESFLKASLAIRIISTTFLVLLILAYPSFVARKLLATDDITLSYWAVVLSFGLLFWSFFPIVLQAYRRFVASVTVDIILGITRILFVLAFVLFGGLTLGKVLGSFILGMIFAAAAGFWFIGTKFLKAGLTKNVYVKLLRFSGWIGVNRVASAISGRLDVQMLAALVGATATGFYSISSRLALFIVLLASSFSAVLAPRFASFDDRSKEKAYLLKATLATIPIVVGVVFWIIIAKPFILILFGEKYLPAVPVFRALAAAMIPFLLTAPSVTAIIYAMKKPVYIGTFSFFQLGAIFLLNLVFIPKSGSFGPTITFGIVYTILAIYTWAIVIRHYWFEKKVNG